MMSKKLLLIGGGGHCKIVIEAVESTGAFDQIGIIDLPENIGKSILSQKIIGEDQDLIKLKDAGYNHAFISLGSIGDPTKRMKLFQMISQLKFQLPIIIEKSAIISQSARISAGTYVGKNVIVNANAVIGKAAILNTGCIIEHDCRIGDFTHVAPGVVLSGNVAIGEGVHIGAGSVIRQNCEIGDHSIIGIGSIVVKDVESRCVAFGNPCRKVGHN